MAATFLTLRDARARARAYLNELSAAQWKDDDLNLAIRDASEEVYQRLCAAAPDRVTQFVFWPWLANRSSMWLNELPLVQYNPRSRKVQIVVTAAPAPAVNSSVGFTDTWGLPQSSNGLVIDIVVTLPMNVIEIASALVAQIAALDPTGSRYKVEYTVGTNQFTIESPVGIPFSIDAETSTQAGAPFDALTTVTLQENRPFTPPGTERNQFDLHLHHIRAVWAVDGLKTPALLKGPLLPDWKSDVQIADQFSTARIIDPIDDLTELFSDASAFPESRDLAAGTSGTCRWRVEPQYQMWMRPAPTQDVNLLIAYTPLCRTPQSDNDYCLAALTFWPWLIIESAIGHPPPVPTAMTGAIPVFPDFNQLVPLLAAVNALLNVKQDAAQLYALYERRLQSAERSLAGNFQQQSPPTIRQAVRR